MTVTQEEYLERMVKYLPVLRAALKITQKDLARKIGVTRQSMMNIETKRSPLQWPTYLALVFVFQQNEDTKKLLYSLELFDDKMIEVDI
jgi:DNA-binding XRE family transcriptional regulator